MELERVAVSNADEDPNAFRQDLLEIAQTTLSSKLVLYEKVFLC